VPAVIVLALVCVNTLLSLARHVVNCGLRLACCFSEQRASSRGEPCRLPVRLCLSVTIRQDATSDIQFKHERLSGNCRNGSISMGQRPCIERLPGEDGWLWKQHHRVVRPRWPGKSMSSVYRSEFSCSRKQVVLSFWQVAFWTGLLTQLGQKCRCSENHKHHHATSGELVNGSECKYFSLVTHAHNLGGGNCHSRICSHHDHACTTIIEKVL
jgi:hypothetical protein